MKLVSLLVFIPFLFLVSCTSTQKVNFKDLESLEKKIAIQKKELESKAKIFVTAAKEVTKKLPKTSESHKLELLLSDAELAIGIANPAEKLQADLLAEAKDDSLIFMQHKETEELIVEKDKLIAKKEIVVDKIIKQAEEKPAPKGLMSWLGYQLGTYVGYAGLGLAVLIGLLLIIFIFRKRN